ncbi:MAG: hypothetical protein KF712_09880 [Akkermansiaceae bacterium]|nr:hypothetical protein [Akkermansiaceae bacterium]
MLNELYLLALNLKSSGVEQEPVHVDFGEPGLSSYQNFHIALEAPGRIAFARPLETPESFWTLKKGNFKFFPAVRLSSPLVDLPPDAPQRADFKKTTGEVLYRLLEETPLSLNEFEFKSEREQARRILAWKHKDSESLGILKDFATAFDGLASKPREFSRQLVDALSHTLQGNLDERALKACEALLCGLLKESKNKTLMVEARVQLIFDWLPENKLSGVLYSPRIRRLALDCLNSEEASSHKKAPIQQFECALEKEGEMSPISGPFPDWAAQPVIAKAFKPFSKFSDASCNFRYGRADSEGFPIGEKTAKALISAGNFITSREKMGKNWRPLKNGRFEERNKKKAEASDVLIAVPLYPHADFATVSILAAPMRADEEEKEDDVPSAGKAKARWVEFRQMAESYLQALEKKADEEDLSSSYISFLLLRQISPGQVQLAYSAAPSREHLAECIREWLRAGENLPPSLRVPLPSAKAPSGIGSFPPAILYPEQAISSFPYQWMRDGFESSPVQAPPVGRLLDLFFLKDRTTGDTARELLDELFPRIAPLLVAMGNALHRVDQDGGELREFVLKHSKSQPSPCYHFARTLSLLGLLLHHLNQKRENYMNSTPFEIGKLLAIMDYLHTCYCMVVRDGDIPPSLIGNGLLGRSADSPEEAFAELQERSRIYIGWARSVTPGKLDGVKKKAAEDAVVLLKLADPLCNSLHEGEFSEAMNSAEKAHLFLGYLSFSMGN